jgi:hypothetical protein
MDEMDRMAIEILSYTGLVIFILELTVSTILLFSLLSRWRKTRIPVIGILFSLYIVLIAFVGFEFFFYVINFETIILKWI